MAVDVWPVQPGARIRRQQEHIVALQSDSVLTVPLRSMVTLRRRVRKYGSLEITLSPIAAHHRVLPSLLVHERTDFAGDLAITGEPMDREALKHVEIHFARPVLDP